MADELEALRAKLRARKGIHGFEENVREIEQRISVLERQKRA